MKKLITKSNYKLIINGVYVLIAFSLLVSGLFILSDDTLSWFAYNENVGADGQGVYADYVNVRIEYGIGTENEGIYSCDKWYGTAKEAFYMNESEAVSGVEKTVFSGMTPSDKIIMAVKYTNLREVEYLADIFLQPGNEVYELNISNDEEHYAYFGSQLYITNYTSVSTDQSMNSTITQQPVSSYLVPNPEADSFFTQEVSYFPSHKVAEMLVLPPNGELVVYIEIEFRENDKDQNYYQNFGQNGGICSRKIAAEFYKSGN
ncbi:MAG: hypothetical protein PHD66_04350 [Eubacteriales bacterium]|nr:hypothetical protein [Eubacteriales bacterium]